MGEKRSVVACREGIFYNAVSQEAASFYLVEYSRQKERRWETIYGFSSAFYVLKKGITQNSTIMSYWFIKWLLETDERKKYKGLPRGCWHCELLGLCRRKKEEGWKCYTGCMLINFVLEENTEDCLKVVGVVNI